METKQSGPKPRRELQGYLDETGLLHRESERIFALGLLVSPQINLLHGALIRFRNRTSYYKEFKFTDVGTHNILYYKDLINEFFKAPHSTFLAVVYDKEGLDIKNARKAYNAFCGNIIADFINSCGGEKTTDYVTILADDLSTPKDDHFEKEIRHKIKLKTRRSALNSLIRLESHAVTEIQLCDVLLGALAYAYKIEMGIIINPNKAKLQLVKHIQKKLKVPALSTPIDRKPKNGIRFVIKENQTK
ncbi:MAG TPA: DUF3800 domain-containing protein [Nevskiaceae bacterium]|nr:DUF3800 domain-containing protein [Nevskiaceae bacterium]